MFKIPHVCKAPGPSRHYLLEEAFELLLKQQRIRSLPGGFFELVDDSALAGLSGVPRREPDTAIGGREP